MPALTFHLASDVLQAHQCETDPVGWDALKYLFARDGSTHGVTLSVSADLKFVKRGGAYIRTAYEGGQDQAGTVIPAQGVEGLVTLTVYEQNPNEFRQEEIYRGRLDFTTYESDESGVTCKFKETGFTTALLTRDQTAVDLFGSESLSGDALPSYEPVYATLHSQETLQRYRSAQATQAPAAGQVSIGDQDQTSSDTGGSALLRIGFPDVSINEFDIKDGFGLYVGDSFSPLNVPLYRTAEEGVFTIALGFTNVERIEAEYNRVGLGLNVDYQIDIKYELRITRASGTTTRPLAAHHYDGTLRTLSGYRDNHDHTTTVAATFTESLGVGDVLTLYAEFYVHGFPGNDSSAHWNAIVKTRYDAGAYLAIQAVTTTGSTSCPGLLLHEAFARCVEACTGQRDSFYSEYFGRTDCRIPYTQNGPGAYRLLTNGFLLRGFPLTSAPLTNVTDSRKTLTIALRDLFDSCDATDCLGMGIEVRGGRPVVRVEPRAYFYQDTEVLRLGRVAGLKKSVAAERLYNSATFGYAHWQSGSPNGLDEFNGLRTYALPLTQLKKDYAAVSKVNAAGYLIEEARRDRYAEGTSKEGQADAEPFVICVYYRPSYVGSVLGVPVVIPAGYASETTQAFTTGSISGIQSPATAYNLRLSPGRMMELHAPWFKAGLGPQATKRALLGKADGNAHLVSQRVGDTAPLDEFVSPVLSDLAPPVLLAEDYEFSVRVRRGQMAALKKNPYGRISFLDSLGVRKTGYLNRAERAPQGGLTTFTLSRAAQ